ncbi:MAG: hypothetical protein ABSA67_01160 [Candidatus Brocadiia bacterium]|jgi:hypothetical protein
MHWHWVPPEQVVHAVPAIVLAGLCLLIGAVFVFWGWKIFRVALALMGALVGWAAGLAIAAPLGLGAVIVALPLAIICALLALFLVRLGVFLVAGMWAALLVLGAQELIQAAAARYVAAGVAFIVIGALAVLLWRPVIIFILAMFGAGLIADAAGMTADLFKPGAAARWETAHPWLMFLAIIIVACIGLYHQEEEEHPGHSD